MGVLCGSHVPSSLRAAQSFGLDCNSASCPWRRALDNSRGVSLFFLKLPSFRPQPVPTSQRLRISSCLGRRPKRRNALREKLLSRQDQVRKVVEVTSPILQPESAQPGLNLHRGREVSDSSTSIADTNSNRGGFSLVLGEDDQIDLRAEDVLGEGEISKKSALWNKLENWVERYKSDSELWGVGSVPIFTVYKDSDGNVSRVSVNEDEIIRRSRVETWVSRPKEIRDDYVDVNGKVSRARLVAKEIESGEYKLPENTTIAKFVVEGSKSSFFVDRLHSLNCGGKTLSKLSPQMLFGVLFGYFVFTSLKKLFFTNGKVELSRVEREMLRRKLKSRAERGSFEKGSVEVLKNIPELPVGSNQRPLLDKNELMKSIKTKVSAEGSVISNLDSHFDINDENFNDHVREIREMVKQVHELEREGQQNVDKRHSENDACLLPSTKDKLPDKKSNVDLETHPMVNGSDYSSVPDYSVLAEDSENINFSGVMKNISVGSGTIPCEEAGKPSSFNDFIELETMDNHVAGTLGCVTEIPVEIYAEHANPEFSCGNQDMDVSRNEEMEQGMNKRKNIELNTLQDGEGIRFDSICSDNSSSVGKNHVRVRPKIIVSVKEARDYLSHRYASSIGKEQPNQKTRDKRQILSPLPNGSLNSINEIMKVVKSPKLDVTECAKDNTLSHESHSHMVVNYVPKEKGQQNIIEPSCDVAVTGLPSVDLKTGETGFPCDTSSDHVENKFLQQEATSNHTGEELHCQDQQVKGPEIWNDINDVIIREPGLEDSCTVTVKDEAVTLSGSEVSSVPASMVKNFTDIRMEEGSDNVDCKTLPKANKNVEVRPSATHNETAAVGDSLETKHGINRQSDPDAKFSPASNDDDCYTEVKQLEGEKSWIEKNFQQLDPIIKKIGVGFKENYMAARDKVQGQKMQSEEMGQMALEDELEWMNDDNLREIVFKVRDNELAGQEPFHLMDADERSAFFEGLEKRVEKENEKLLALHELIHTKIENIDYGMDGISVDDPLEKIVPRWKGPPICEDPEFLNNFAQRKQVMFNSKMETSHAVTDDMQDNLQGSDQTSYRVSPSSAVHNLRKPSRDPASVDIKTVIECSDGSSRAGKRLGKEHWEHTKKWSREFLELYNAETDPEVKSIMRDMGKDLDKWITEKEIQDVADLMTKIPKRKRRYIEEKLDKLKRDIETFGHQAVASKYREYSEEKEEDYLWWLDLSFILCIELYRTEDDVPKVGFYSLEMAADLELNPKQYHVIAFEDPGDAKNFCYIIQAHMEMLGNGSAFVIARPPKDAFREAKANGFNVTVVRKGELKLNIDLTLEEVEEEIIEIGSKMYHDKIMHERSIDIGALMKGVFNADKSTKRKSKQMLRKPTTC